MGGWCGLLSFPMGRGYHEEHCSDLKAKKVGCGGDRGVSRPLKKNTSGEQLRTKEVCFYSNQALFSLDGEAKVVFDVDDLVCTWRKMASQLF